MMLSREFLDSLGVRLPQASEGKQKEFGPTRDPRPDLEEDTHLWAGVLEVAYHKYREAHGPLHGMRCMGARLVLAGGVLRMKPRFHAGEKPRIVEFDDMEHYCRLRNEYLVPCAREITAVFRAVGEEMGS